MAGNRHKVGKRKWWILCPHCDRWFKWTAPPGRSSGRKPDYCWRAECHQAHMQQYFKNYRAEKKLVKQLYKEIKCQILELE